MAIAIKDLRGGLNNHDEPQSIGDDQVVESVNIDWDKGTLGGKRAGCEEVSITGSVLDRVVPVLVSTTIAKVTSSTTLNLTVPSSASDGTGTTYRLLVVKVVSKDGAVTVSSATFAGVGMTLEFVSGTHGRTSIYSVTGPALAGGTVAITWGSSVDAVAVAELWGRTDAFVTDDTANGTSTSVLTELDTSPIHMIGGLASYENTATATSVTPGTTTNALNETSGTVRIASSYTIGRSPQVSQLYTLSGSAAWSQALFAIRGAPRSAFPTSGFVVTALMRHAPTNNVLEDELWLIDSSSRMDRRVNGTWQGGVPRASMYNGTFDHTGLDINGASLHGKFFLAMNSQLNGLHVWDGTVLRFAGFVSAPPVPTAGNTGSGSYAGTRYFRIRFTEQDDDGNTIRRSEPSLSVSLAPSGSGSGALITKPTGTEAFHSAHCNGQTHWEVEASDDDTDFYRIATVAIGTGTYTDTTASGQDYALEEPSEDIGEYQAPPSVRHVAVDDDRLVMAGHRQEAGLDSRFLWTPVESAVGVGNDERIPLSTDNYIDLDNLDGGNIQAFVAGELGTVYAFKRERIYKLMRTGELESAYSTHTESTTRGSTKRGAIAGSDAFGNPCVYFTDPSVGACRVGVNGIQQLMNGLLSHWRTVRGSNPTSEPGPRLVFWPDKNQLWVAVRRTSGASQFLVYNTRFGADGMRGWSIYESTLFTSTGILYGTVFPNGSTGKLFPHWGMANPAVVIFNDTAVNDAGTRYRAYWRSKAFILGELIAKFTAKASVVFAKAASATIELGLIRNLGVETKRVTASLALTVAEGSATHVFRPMDNATIAECLALQVELGDPVSFTGAQLDQTWVLDGVSVKTAREEDSV